MTVYALYARSKAVLYTVVMLFTGNLAVGIMTMVKSVPVGKFSVDLGCVVVWVPSIFIATW